MNYYLDCEFNEQGGELISIAIVGRGGGEFYRVLAFSDEPTPWVAANVIPVLGGQSPRPESMVRTELAAWLRERPGAHIIADWPLDLLYFFRLLCGPNYAATEFVPVTCEVREIKSGSRVPHNALWDARGLLDAAEARPAPEPANGG